MQRHLKSIYKWSVGKVNATRPDFLRWLDDLIEWYEPYSMEGRTTELSRRERNM